MDNALIIDLVLAAVLALFALLGARKGLIRSLMALVSVVVALIGATLLTAMFVEPVTDLVYPRVEERSSRSSSAIFRPTRWPRRTAT
ncbi:MAG: CvpA family protein [Oscillospiraceae bacterium]